MVRRSLIQIIGVQFWPLCSIQSSMNLNISVILSQVGCWIRFGFTYEMPSNKYSIPGQPGTKFPVYHVLIEWFIMRRCSWDSTMAQGYRQINCVFVWPLPFNIRNMYCSRSEPRPVFGRYCTRITGRLKPRVHWNHAEAFRCTCMHWSQDGEDIEGLLTITGVHGESGIQCGSTWEHQRQTWYHLKSW